MTDRPEPPRSDLRADDGRARPGDGRAARLARALRDNLRRRKGQARARAAGPGPETAAGGGED